VVAVRSFDGGSAHANHLLTLADGSEVVLRRWARPGWELTDADYDARREASVLALLAPAGVAAPRLLAADVDGAVCDVPALLVTRVHGEPPRGLPDVAQLAGALAAIHAVPGAREAIPPYRPYVRSWEPPPQVRGRRVWERAFEEMRAESRSPSSAPACLIHRDYHPANTLWTGGRLTAVVDWTNASYGPPEVDVGHMRWNLAVDHGPDAADAFLAAWRSQTGASYDHWWDVRTAADLLCDPVEPDLLERIEAHVERALG
jgi:aminoglycoside phosphotransferase (APT) family kinase protein